MYTVASVSSVASPSRAGSVYGVNAFSSVSSTQATKASSNVGQAKSVPTPQSTPLSASQNVPLGLLMSVSQPASSNTLANLDYQALRIALASGNVTGAQQAYSRMQSDLLLALSSQPNPANPATDGNNHLNVTG